MTNKTRDLSLLAAGLLAFAAPSFAGDGVEKTRGEGQALFDSAVRNGPLRAKESAGGGAAPAPEQRTAAAPVKAAFIGDQGNGAAARSTLELIKAEDAEVVFHQGDFDYKDNPEAWDGLINEVLGPSFPYFASVGNHDMKAWPGYQRKLADRLKKIPGASCEGDLGALSACRYRGLVFLLMGVDLMKDNDYPAYIRGQLAAETAPWKICSWHIPHYLMQVGDKKNVIDWNIYDECRKAGAIIATGHEHSYSRTGLMEDFASQRTAPDGAPLRLQKGRTFAFVSGLGGESIRGQSRGGAWWASIYTAKQKADYGALFCTFGSPKTDAASCYFKDIEGRIADSFDLQSLP